MTTRGVRTVEVLRSVGAGTVVDAIQRGLGVALIIASAVAIGDTALAEAAGDTGGYYVPAPVYVPEPVVEARGCYFYRGRRTCGRYCYIEVDGKRYCRDRPREAYPQGVIDGPLYVPGPSMK